MNEKDKLHQNLWYIARTMLRDQLVLKMYLLKSKKGLKSIILVSICKKLKKGRQIQPKLVGRSNDKNKM